MINDRPASVVNLTYLDIKCALLGSRWRFAVNGKHGFQRWRSTFVEYLYIFKGYEAKNLLRNFRLKVGDCGDWINFWKSCKNLARHQDKVAASKHKEYFSFFYCVILIHKLDIRKKCIISLQIFFAATLTNIICKNRSAFDGVMTKIKKWTFLRHSVYIS